MQTTKRINFILTLKFSTNNAWEFSEQLSAYITGSSIMVDNTSTGTFDPAEAYPSYVSLHRLDTGGSSTPAKWLMKHILYDYNSQSLLSPCIMDSKKRDEFKVYLSECPTKAVIEFISERVSKFLKLDHTQHDQYCTFELKDVEFRKVILERRIVITEVEEIDY